MNGFHWATNSLTGWLGRFFRRHRGHAASKVVPLTMHDVARQRRAVFGEIDRTPCSCPVCRRERDEAA